MAVDLYNPASLKKGVVDKVEKPYEFLITEIFNKKGTVYPSDIVRIDSEPGTHTPAPLTTRGFPGQLIQRNSYDSDYVIPAHIRLKDKFDSFDLVSVDVGSSYMDTKNLSARLADKVAKQLKIFKQKIWLRIETMCAAMITAGVFTYTNQANGVKYSIDYQQSGSAVLTKKEWWDAATANIMGDIDTMIKYHRGDIDTILLSSAAWDLMQIDSTFLGILNNRNITGNYLSPLAGKYYVGTVKGIDLFHYFGTSTDEAGSATDLLTAKFIYGLSRKANNFRIDFGRCSEINFGEAAVVDFFSKIYNQDDPAGRFIIMESNPVPNCDNVSKISRMQVDE